MSGIVRLGGGGPTPAKGPQPRHKDGRFAPRGASPDGIAGAHQGAANPGEPRYQVLTQGGWHGPTRRVVSPQVLDQQRPS